MEPNAKRSKLDNGVLVLNKLKGHIELRIEVFSEFLAEKEDWYSDTVRIRGLDWTLCATPSSGPTKRIDFKVDCNCDSRGTDWNCVASVTLLCISGSKEVEMGREVDIKCDATSINTEYVWFQRVSIEVLQY